MEYVIAFLLLVIAVMMVFKRPLDINIKVTHKLEQPPASQMSPEEQKEEYDNKKMMTEVAKVIQDIMLGGDLNEHNGTQGEI
jgi:hypothetical protein